MLPPDDEEVADRTTRPARHPRTPWWTLTTLLDVSSCPKPCPRSGASLPSFRYNFALGASAPAAFSSRHAEGERLAADHAPRTRSCPCRRGGARLNRMTPTRTSATKPRWSLRRNACGSIDAGRNRLL
jgi:hypothetical protein